MTDTVHRIRREWGAWVWLPWITLIYAAVVLPVGGTRPEHIIVGLICLLAYVGPRARRFFLDVLPYVLVGLSYDAVRYVRRAFVRPDDIFVCELRDLELKLFPFFGPETTPQDYFAAHPVAAADVAFSVPYAVFAYVALVYAAYLYFKDRDRMRHFLWAFFAANLLSFVIWMIVPAAPPWYVREFGCTADLSVAPSAGTPLLRVDQYFGVDYFETWYSRTSWVFGAMPSMHNGYPMLGLLTAWPHISWKTKPLHLLYVAWMFSAAVYLDHHWITDCVAGWLIALVAVGVTGKLLGREWPRARSRESGHPAAGLVAPGAGGV